MVRARSAAEELAGLFQATRRVAVVAGHFVQALGALRLTMRDPAPPQGMDALPSKVLPSKVPTTLAKSNLDSARLRQSKVPTTLAKVILNSFWRYPTFFKNFHKSTQLPVPS